MSGILFIYRVGPDASQKLYAGIYVLWFTTFKRQRRAYTVMPANTAMTMSQTGCETGL